MTMHKPDPWVIRPKCDDEIPIAWQEGNISSRRVVIVESLWGYRATVCRISLPQDNKVVAVKVDGMCGWDKDFILMGKILGSDDEVYEAVIKILADDGVVLVEALVVQIQYCGVGEVKPVGVSS